MLSRRYRSAGFVTLLAGALLINSELKAQVAAPDLQGLDVVSAEAAKRGRISIIAELTRRDPLAPMSASAADRAAQDLASFLAPLGVTSVRSLGALPYVALEVDQAQLAALVRSGRVGAVGLNSELYRNLADSVPLIRAPQAWAAGARGAGKVVVIVDDGVSSTHPFLAGRVVASVCSAPDCGSAVVEAPGAGEPCAGCDHGTHVAGIAAGKGSSFSGVAPDASVISVRVFGPSTTWEHLIRGLDYVRTNLASRFSIAAVNMSLGDGSSRGSDCDSLNATYAAVTTVINGLRAGGILSAIASGNEGYTGGISAPACIGAAISVGSTTKSDSISSFSNSAGILDVLAPGSSIYSSVPGGYGFKSGTSMATPHVAGALTALRSKVPAATAAQLEAALESSGVGILDSRNGLTKPRIDVFAALVALGGTPSWKPWESVAGVGIVGRPECIVTGSGQFDCFINTPGFRIAWNRWTAAGWRGWNDLGGVSGSTVSCVTRGTRLHCFIIGLDNKLQQNVYDGTAWSGWIVRSTAGLSNARPSCLGFGSAGIRCYAVNAAGKVIEHAYTGSAWLKPVDLGGSTSARPACFNRGSGIDCFALFKTTKKLNWRRYNGSTWSAWKVVGSSTLSTPPSCVVRGSVLHCFALGSGSAGPLMTSRLTGTSWSAWTNLGGVLKEQPSCIPFGSGGIECFAQTSGSTLWRRSYNGTSWAAAQDLGGSITSRPSCVSASAGRIDCTAPGSDAVLKRIAYF